MSRKVKRAYGTTELNHFHATLSKVSMVQRYQEMGHWTHEHTLDKLKELVYDTNSYQRLGDYYTGVIRGHIEARIMKRHNEYDHFVWLHKNPDTGQLIDTRNASSDNLPDRIHERMCKEKWESHFYWQDTLPQVDSANTQFAPHLGKNRTWPVGEYFDAPDAKYWS